MRLTSITGCAAYEPSGGIRNHGTLNLSNSIVAGNTPGNIEGTFTGTNNLTSGDPLLAPLGNYGGPTQTRPPLPGSPAIDPAGGATTSTFTTDQRGFPRVVDGDGNGIAVADIGAVEVSPTVVTTNLDQLDTPTGPQTSLREAVRDGADYIVFDTALSGQTITLGGSAIVLASSVTIDASGLAGGITLNGNAASRVFQVNSGTTVALTALTIANGNGAGSSGGGIRNLGALTINQCTLAGNSALAGFADGGGIINESGAGLTVNRCTFTGNSAAQGGGIFNSGTLTVNQSTLAANTTVYGGPAIFNESNLEVNQSTISDHSPHGIYQNGSMTLSNSIVAGNGSENIYVGAPFTGSNNVTSGDPLLAPLGSYGGPTKTMALLPGSPARNAGGATAFISDQRGFPIVGTADIGAYETQIGAIANTTTNEDTATGAIGFSVGTVGALSASSGNTALVPNANIALGGGGTARTVAVTPVADANGSATITLTDSLTGETQSFLATFDAVNDTPAFTKGADQMLLDNASAQSVTGWATGISVGPANESGQAPSFNVSNDNNGIFAAQPAVAANGTLTFTPAAGARGVATVMVSLSDNGNPVATSAAQSFTITVHLAMPLSTKLIASGEPAPGRLTSTDLPDDAVIVSFGPPATDDAGNIAFIAKWTSATGPVKRGTGLFLNDQCLAVVGGASPVAGATWKSFSNPVVDAGKVAFIAKLSTGASAVVRGDAGGFEKIARTGEAEKFKSFKSVAIAGGSVGFLAQHTAPAASDLALWMKDGAGPLTQVLREGDAFSGSEIKSS